MLQLGKHWQCEHFGKGERTVYHSLQTASRIHKTGFWIILLKC